MDQRLFGQRKDQYLYNHQVHQALSEVCDPLFSHMNIQRFAHFIYPLNEDGTCNGFQGATTHIKSLMTYMLKFDDNGTDFTKAIQETPLDTFAYFLWPTGSKCGVLKMLQEEFNLIKGLSIYKRYKDRVETWCFSTTDVADFPVTLHQKTLEPFHQFIKYYESKENIVSYSPLVEYAAPIDMNFSPPTDQAEFINLLNAARKGSSSLYSLEVKGKKIDFSPREWDCLLLHSQGRTCKEIAKLLKISPRTVECYVNHVKKKLGLHFKSELVDLFWKNQKGLSNLNSFES